MLQSLCFALVGKDLVDSLVSLPGVTKQSVPLYDVACSCECNSRVGVSVLGWKRGDGEGGERRGGMGEEGKRMNREGRKEGKEERRRE